MPLGNKENKTMTTKPIEATRCFYVTHSPRGFANELSVAVFATKKEADEFRDETDNNVNAWTVPTSSPSHRREVAVYKKETAQHYTGSPLTRYKAWAIEKY